MDSFGSEQGTCHMSDTDEIIAMERAALDRWGAGDPRGYLEIMAPEVTYFDPVQERRVDGLPAMTALLLSWTGKIKVDRYEMVSPRVQQHGDAALLTFNLVSYRWRADGTEHPIAQWNSTELYARFDDNWRIVHSHWSFVRPELKQPMSEES
jgi:ketosteroid isomerase-like protein